MVASPKAASLSTGSTNTSTAAAMATTTSGPSSSATQSFTSAVVAAAAAAASNNAAVNTSSDVISVASSVTVKQSNVVVAASANKQPLKSSLRRLANPLQKLALHNKGAAAVTTYHPDDEDDDDGIDTSSYETLARVPVIPDVQTVEIIGTNVDGNGSGNSPNEGDDDRPLIRESFLLRSLLALPPMTLRRVLKDIPHLAGKSAAELQSLWTDTTQLDNDDLRRLSNAYFAHIGGGSSRHLHSNGNAGWSRRWLEGCWQRNHKNGYEKTLSSMSSSQNSSPTAGGHSGAPHSSGRVVVNHVGVVPFAATNSSSTTTDASNRDSGRNGGGGMVTLASSSDSPMFPQPLEPRFVGIGTESGGNGTKSNRLKLTQTVQHHLEKTVRHPLEKSVKSATHRTTPTVSSQNPATGTAAVNAADDAAAAAAQVDAATKDGNVSLGSV